KAVVCQVFLGLLNAQAHLFELKQLELDEFNWHTLDGNLRIGRHGGGDKGHRLNGILTWAVRNIFLDILDTAHPQRSSTDPINLDAQLLKEAADILNSVVGAGVFNNRLLLEAGSRHQCIFGDSVARLVEDNFRRVSLINLNVVMALRGHDVNAKLLK